MIRESGRVVAVDEDGVWVETLSTSACAQCAAKSGCGQNLAARLFPGSNFTLIKAMFVSRAESFSWRVGDRAEIGVPENALLAAAGLAYLMPLLLMLVGALVAHASAPVDAAAAIGAALGLGLGALLVKRVMRSEWSRHYFQASVLGKAPSDLL